MVAINLLLLKLFGADAKIIHSFLDSWGVQVEVDPGQLSDRPDLSNVVFLDRNLRLLLLIRFLDEE